MYVREEISFDLGWKEARYVLSCSCDKLDITSKRLMSSFTFALVNLRRMRVKEREREREKERERERERERKERDGKGEVERLQVWENERDSSL